MRYTKFYTVKQWQQFDKVAEIENGIEITWQELLLKKYDVILTDHTTTKQKVHRVVMAFNFKNLDKGLKMFDKGMNTFNKEISKGLGTNKDDISMWPKKKDLIRI